ncbi:hypothetical protein EVB53_088 [Rhizobium phage RHph_Y60]|nr:hypothetical protein EVB53_088 [Rhizobium phage RHph_Y60]
MMTRETRRIWDGVQAATLALGVTDDPFVRKVLSVYLESDDLDELRAELAFVDDPDVLAWYRAVGVE